MSAPARERAARPPLPYPTPAYPPSFSPDNGPDGGAPCGDSPPPPQHGGTPPPPGDRWLPGGPPARPGAGTSGSAPEPRPSRLRDRVTPQQLVLGAGAVAVVGTGWAALTVGTVLGVIVVVGLLLVCAALAVLAGGTGSPTAGETLALCAVASAGVLVWVGGTTAPDGPLAAATLAGFVAATALALRLISPHLRTWPVTAWVAAQLTVLILLPDAGLTGLPLAAVLLAVALVGLTVAVVGSDVVAEAGLLSALPWWVCGVVVAERLAWGGPDSVAAAGMAVGAAIGLLAAAWGGVPHLPTRAVVPVLAGVTAGAAVAGAALSGPPGWVVGAGLLGLGLAAAVAVAAARGPDWVPRAAGLSAAVTLTGLSAVALGREERWAELGLLLVVTTAAAGLLATRSRGTRPSSLPVTVATAAAAVALLLDPRTASLLVVTIAVVALGASLPGVLLSRAVDSRAPAWVLGRARAVTRSRRRRPPGPGPADLRDAFAARDTGRPETTRRARGLDEAAAAGTATTAAVVGLLGVLVAARHGASGLATVLLAVLGVALLVHGDLVDRRLTRVLGGLAVVVATGAAGAQLGWTVPETVTVPAGLVLLAARRRQLDTLPSWSGWGPGLGVAVLPSVLLAAGDPQPLRQVLVLVAALACVALGLSGQLRAPLVLGGLAVVGITAGWVLGDHVTGWVLPLLVTGVVLLAIGRGRELQARRQPVPDEGPADDDQPTRQWLSSFR